MIALTFDNARLTQELTLAVPPEEFAEPLGGRYKIQRELGRGGMAVVYLATDLTTGEEVALKLLDQEVGAAVGGDRFRREIRIATELSHPHILRVLDAGEAKGQLFFTMPVVEGQSLYDHLVREEQLPVEEAVRITREVASALAYAHERGVVHRDVKPENILMQDGHALLADFGIARASSDLRATQALTRTGMSLGTPTYMSPEQSAAERELDGRSDQYSLACVLYEMLAGQAPFTAKTAQALMARHMLEPVPSLSIVRNTVPEPVEEAIVRAMSKSPADRFPTIEQFSEALGSPESWPKVRGAPTRTYAVPSPAPSRSRKKIWVAAGASVLGVAAIGSGFWYLQNRPRDAVPSVLLAIAPFNPLRPEFALWQEGMVDVLARNLDGAGQLGTVAPAVAIRGWGGQKADRVSARALAERTGARYAVFGSINAAPGNLVQVSASLLDVKTDSLWDGSWTGIEVKQLADSATLFVIKQLSNNYSIRASQNSQLAGISVDALKQFLEGERQFRRTAWKPALNAYTRAATLDTTFALPFRRMGQIISFERDNADSLGRSYALHAGRLNQGLAPRDSLLVTADSLFAALAARESELSDWPLLRRLFATLDVATKRYPSDPEVWYAKGEAGYHLGYGSVVDVTDEQVFEAFEKAIALDSGFAPAYIHGIELAFRLRGRVEGRRYAEAYLALNPTDHDAEGIRLLARLTDPAQRNDPAMARLIDTLPHDVLASAYNALGRWPDSAAAGLTLVRAIARRPATSVSHVDDSALVHNYLPLELAFRGRLREAYEALGNRRSQLFAELVVLGGIEQDTANAVFSRWLADGSVRTRSALPFWSAQGNTASIQQFLKRADSISRTASGRSRLLATHDAGAARAYLQLTQRDTAAAIKAFGQLSDTLCLSCYQDRLTEARLLAARGKLEDADRLLRQRLYAAMTPIEVLIALERGRVAQRMNDVQTARRAYELVVDAWQNGDPEVQPMVAEARQALQELAKRPVQPDSSTVRPRR